MTYTIPMRRSFERGLDDLRPVSIETNVIPHAEGSAYIRMGNTLVLCTASVDENVPRWMKGTGKGWVTAEYSLLPRSTKERTDREAVKGKQGGRTVEIQRLIGRSLRAATDMKALGERQIILDCDVIVADGGTRCAAITGAWVALALAGQKLVAQKKLRTSPVTTGIAAVSVGIVNGVPLLDLDYSEDVKADVDANIVMTNAGEFVEIQGTAEGNPFSMDAFTKLITLADKGIRQLFEAQQAAING